MNFLNLLDKAEARDNARLARPQGIMRKRSSSLIRMSRAAARSVGDGFTRTSRSGRRPPIPAARGLPIGGPALDTARRAPHTPRTPRAEKKASSQRPAHPMQHLVPRSPHATNWPSSSRHKRGSIYRAVSPARPSRPAPEQLSPRSESWAGGAKHKPGSRYRAMSPCRTEPPPAHQLEPPRAAAPHVVRHKRGSRWALCIP